MSDGNYPTYLRYPRDLILMFGWPLYKFDNYNVVNIYHTIA